MFKSFCIILQYELPDPLPWHQRVNKNLLKKLSKQEVNKQSNINELIDTEMQHFANLVMINKVFDLKTIKVPIFEIYFLELNLLEQIISMLTYLISSIFVLIFYYFHL